MTVIRKWKTEWAFNENFGILGTENHFLIVSAMIDFSPLQGVECCQIRSELFPQKIEYLDPFRQWMIP